METSDAPRHSTPPSPDHVPVGLAAVAPVPQAAAPPARPLLRPSRRCRSANPADGRVLCHNVPQLVRGRRITVLSDPVPTN